jgi:hypothetical protein
VLPIKAKAVCDFHPKNETELSLSANDDVTIIEKDESGWWKVTKGDEMGFVPQSYLRALE